MEKVRKVKFTNLQKTIYPQLGVNKYQVIDYYIKTAPRMLEFLKDRALTLNRFPDGIDQEGFWEKDAPKGTPYWVETFTRYSETAQRDVTYVVCNNIETLTWLANLAALEINIPLHRTSSPDHPDLVLFDLDPEPPATFEHARQVALQLKSKLDLLGLDAYVKTSGQKGLHIVLPVEPRYTFRQTLAFVHTMGQLLAKESNLVVSEFRQSKVPGTVFIDYMQNIRFKTMVCPYSLRANEHAAVSTPVTWNEIIEGLNPQDLNIFTMLDRQRNPWKGLFEHPQTLDFEDIAQKGTKVDTRMMEQAPVALREYARKRDFTQTSEPVGHARPEQGSIFVVQEHHARRLHYDFRLEREGVLKSWAVPKDIPETPKVKRLAIQTEDHPLAYGHFEGTIPKGQYGAGMVQVWDKGLYDLKIWTDDKIEFSLRGRKLRGRYVLVKLKKPAAKPRRQDEWLLMKLKE